MRLDLRLALLGILSGGALLWPTDRVTAQTWPIFRPVVPASSTVRTVGAVDPAEPIDLLVTNSLAVPLGVGFSGGANLEVAPGDTAKVSFAAAPINLFVYPLASDVSLRSVVAIDGNTINAQIIPRTSDAPGDATLNVDGDGTVYIY